MNTLPVKYVLLFVAFDLSITKSSEIGNRTLNVALETVLEFHHNNSSDDVQLLDNVERIIKTVKNAINNNESRRNFRKKVSKEFDLRTMTKMYESNSEEKTQLNKRNEFNDYEDKTIEKTDDKDQFRYKEKNKKYFYKDRTSRNMKAERYYTRTVNTRHEFPKTKRIDITRLWQGADYHQHSKNSDISESEEIEISKTTPRIKSIYFKPTSKVRNNQSSKALRFSPYIKTKSSKYPPTKKERLTPNYKEKYMFINRDKRFNIVSNKNTGRRRFEGHGSFVETPKNHRDSRSKEESKEEEIRDYQKYEIHHSESDNERSNDNYKRSDHSNSQETRTSKKNHFVVSSRAKHINKSIPHYSRSNKKKYEFIHGSKQKNIAEKDCETVIKHIDNIQKELNDVKSIIKLKTDFNNAPKRANRDKTSAEVFEKKIKTTDNNEEIYEESNVIKDKVKQTSKQSQDSKDKNIFSKIEKEIQSNEADGAKPRSNSEEKRRFRTEDNNTSYIERNSKSTHEKSGITKKHNNNYEISRKFYEGIDSWKEVNASASMNVENTKATESLDAINKTTITENFTSDLAIKSSNIILNVTNMNKRMNTRKLDTTPSIDTTYLLLTKQLELTQRPLPENEFIPTKSENINNNDVRVTTNKTTSKIIISATDKMENEIYSVMHTNEPSLHDNNKNMTNAEVVNATMDKTDMINDMLAENLLNNETRRFFNRENPPVPEDFNMLEDYDVPNDIMT